MTCDARNIRQGKLVIPITPVLGMDKGDRPLPPGTPFWVNPNINLLRNNQVVPAAVAGRDYTIAVTVFNNSEQEVKDVEVEVWVIDFSVGMSRVHALESAGGIAGRKGGISSVASGEAGTATVNWTPADADLKLNAVTLPNGDSAGHVCIAANVWANTPHDGESFSAQGSQGKFFFMCDCHHAQRNILIVPATGGQMVASAHVFVDNPFDRPLKTVVKAQWVRELGPAVAEALTMSHPRTVQGRSPPPQWGVALQPEPWGSNPSESLVLDLQPHERRSVWLHVGMAGMGRGEVHAFDLSQADAEDKDQYAFGGARIVVVGDA